jgi:NurA-like 5'-3' nuclease
MVRIRTGHLNDITNKLSRNYAKITEVRKHINEHIQWNELPPKKEGNLCGIDGSMSHVRLCGGILYAVSANAIGRTVDRGMFEMNAIFDSRNINDRIRRLMGTLEYRIAAISGKNSELLLIDGSLSGALITPPLLSSLENPTTLHPKEAKKLGNTFLKSLNKFYSEVLENVEGHIYENTILAQKIFQDFDSEYSEYVMDIREDMNLDKLIDPNNKTNWEIFFEYIELLHALDKLLDYDCVFISKTFYSSLISKSIKEGGVTISYMLDAPLLNMSFPQCGYTVIKYEGDSRLHVNSIYEAFKEGFPNLGEIRDKTMGVNKSYCRFIDGGNLLSVETPKTNKKPLEEVISLLSPYSELGYPIHLQNAHHRTKISKKEFDSYVSMIMNWTGNKNHGVIPFFQDGRSVL